MGGLTLIHPDTLHSKILIVIMCELERLAVYKPVTLDDDFILQFDSILEET